MCLRDLHSDNCICWRILGDLSFCRFMCNLSLGESFFLRNVWTVRPLRCTWMIFLKNTCRPSAHSPLLQFCCVQCPWFWIWYWGCIAVECCSSRPSLSELLWWNWSFTPETWIVTGLKPFALHNYYFFGHKQYEECSANGVFYKFPWRSHCLVYRACV